MSSPPPPILLNDICVICMYFLKIRIIFNIYADLKINIFTNIILVIILICYQLTLFFGLIMNLHSVFSIRYKNHTASNEVTETLWKYKINCEFFFGGGKKIMIFCQV